MKNVSENSSVHAKSEKDKVMIHLPIETSEKIDDVIFSLRKRLPRNKRKKLTKSKFYELIALSMLNDLKSMGNESILVKVVDAWADD